MKEQLLKTIQDSRKYTLAVAEALPETHYNSILVNGTWSFGELMNHMAYSIGWWEDNFLKGKETEWAPPTPKTSKKEVIKLLSNGFDALTHTVSGLPISDKVVIGVWATLDHITHHRGQAVLHVRQHQVTPPEYVGIS